MTENGIFTLFTSSSNFVNRNDIRPRPRRRFPFYNDVVCLEKYGMLGFYSIGNEGRLLWEWLPATMIAVPPRRDSHKKRRQLP
jgi:hypothetical protein